MVSTFFCGITVNPIPEFVSGKKNSPPWGSIRLCPVEPQKDVETPTTPEACVENCVVYINGQKYEQLDKMKGCVWYSSFLRPLLLSLPNRYQKTQLFQTPDQKFQ